MTEMRHISTGPPVFTQYSFYIVCPARHMILYKGPIGPSMGTNQYFISRQSDYESSARSYPRKFPLAIAKAKGAVVEDVEGNRYIDFLNGAGTLALGHNDEERAQTLVGVLDGYFNQGSHHLNVNVFGIDKLKDAMEHPEKEEYQNFTIRVSGYAVKFIDLTREQQLDVIARQAHERL